MKKNLTLLAFLLSYPTLAEFDALPDSPLDTDMGETRGNTIGTLNQLTPDEKFEEEQEKEKQEELLENRYDVPSDEEEDEFNKNGPGI